MTDKMTITPSPLRSVPSADRPDRRLGARLVVGALASAAVSIPFTVLALLVLAEFEPLEAADRRIALAFNGAVLPRPAIASLFEVLAVVTHPNVWRVVAALIAVVLWTRGRRRVAVWLAVTMAVGGVLSPVLKAVVARARPTFDDPVTTAGGYSFPSGHALNSMLFAACLIVLAHPLARGLRRAALWAFAVLVVVVTGLDRVALGVHFVSDVLAGWVVALATVTGTTVAFALWRRSAGLQPSSLDEGLDPTSAQVARPRLGTAWSRPLGRLAMALLLRWGAVLAVLVTAGAIVTRASSSVWPLTVEDGVNRALAAGRTPAGDTVSSVMSSFGNTSTVVPLCVVAVVVLWRLLRRWREPLLVGAVTLGQSVVFVLTTIVIDRERPEVGQLDQSPPTSSFPSGHTSAAIALYASLAVVVHRRVARPWVRRGLMAVLLSLPVLVATGRLYRGMHHPSDVLGSLLNAGLVLLLTDRLLRSAHLPDDDGARPGRLSKGAPV